MSPVASSSRDQYVAEAAKAGLSMAGVAQQPLIVLLDALGRPSAANRLALGQGPRGCGSREGLVASVPMVLL
jgi:hypothetical protein